MDDDGVDAPQFSAERWTVPILMEELKAKAKAQGLWNLFLPVESDPGLKVRMCIRR